MCECVREYSGKGRSMIETEGKLGTIQVLNLNSMSEVGYNSFCPLTEAEVSKLLLSSHPTTCALDPISS